MNFFMDELAIKDRLLLPLHRDGYPFVVIAVILTVVLGLIDSIFWLPGIIASGLLYFFFRVPNSTAPNADGVLLAAASGTVLAVEASAKGWGSNEQEKSAEKNAEQFAEPFVISISVTLLDSGVLRFPLAGQVLRRQDKPASPSGFDFAKARENAARVTLSLRGAGSDSGGASECDLILRAGVLGRSLSIDLPSSGEDIASASAFGFVRFGGKVDIIFDASKYQAVVSVGQRVIAGESIIAHKNNQ